MTPEHEDAGNARVQEMLSWHDSGELAEFSRAGLEAWLHDLIAEVRRQALEEAAASVMKIAMKHCNKQQTEYFDDIGPALEMAADAILARLDSPSGKDEGK